MQFSTLLLLLFVLQAHSTIYFNNGNLPRGKLLDRNVHVAATDFLTAFTEAKNTGKPENIEKFIEPNFSFSDCITKYNKDNFVNKVSHIPQNAKWSFELNAAKFVNGTLKLNVKNTFTNGTTHDFSTTLLVSQTTRRLTAGRSNRCKKNNFLDFMECGLCF